MTDNDGNGIYTKEIQMKNGDYKFIFTINGWDGVKRDKEKDYEEWISPGKEGLDCDVSPEYNEYVIQVFEEDMILDPICWKQCTNCNGDIINASHSRTHLIVNSISLLVIGTLVVDSCDISINRMLKD